MPFAWVLGDEVYGSDRRLRIDLEQQECPFVLAIRSNEKLWSTLDDRPGQHAAAALAAAIPEAAWQPLSAGAGAKGERLYDWARVRLMRLQQSPWEHWLLVRRHPSKPDQLAYYVVFGPVDTTLATLARVAGRRWAIEECFEVAKQRSAWPITRSALGTAGTGTSPWPCWRWPFSRRCASSSRPPRQP